MKHLFAVLFMLALLLMCFSGCAQTETTTAATGTKLPEGAKFIGSSKPEGAQFTPKDNNADKSAQDNAGEHPIQENGAGVSRTEAKRSANTSGFGIENSNSSKIITGTVKSIVGNEVVLIVTQNSVGAQTQENKEISMNVKDDSSADNISSQQELGSKQQNDNALQQDTAELHAAGNEPQQVIETYLIPVGMAIGNKDFTAIKAGDTLTIYFGTDSNDGSEIITAVELK